MSIFEGKPENVQKKEYWLISLLPVPGQYGMLGIPRSQHEAVPLVAVPLVAVN